jgi:hypothetical protein
MRPIGKIVLETVGDIRSDFAFFYFHVMLMKLDVLKTVQNFMALITVTVSQCCQHNINTLLQTHPSVTLAKNFSILLLVWGVFRLCVSKRPACTETSYPTKLPPLQYVRNLQS